MNIGSRLKSIREELNIAQGNFALSIGLEQGSYSDLERGKTKKISKSVALLLELIYGINIDYLNSGKGEKIKSGAISESPKENSNQKIVDENEYYQLKNIITAQQMLNEDLKFLTVEQKSIIVEQKSIIIDQRKIIEDLETKQKQRV